MQSFLRTCDEVGDGPRCLYAPEDGSFRFKMVAGPVFSVGVLFSFVGLWGEDWSPDVFQNSARCRLFSTRLQTARYYIAVGSDVSTRQIEAEGLRTIALRGVDETWCLKGNFIWCSLDAGPIRELSADP